MKTFIKQHQTYFECLIYGLLSGSVIGFLIKKGIALSPDSINYLSIAKIINVGKLSEAFVTIWPPFFPMLIALINSFGFEGEKSAQIISVISYSTLVLIMFLLANATAGKLVAHFTSFSMLFFAPLLFVYNYLWSETVFITLSSISLLFLDRFLKSTNTRKSYVHLIWGGVFTGLAFLTRYAGVALFLAGLTIVGFKDGMKIYTRKIKFLLLFCLIACTPITLYLVGCLYYGGKSIPSSDHVITSLWQNFGLFFTTIYHDFFTFALNFPGYMITWHPNAPIQILGKIAGSIFIILGLLYITTQLFKKTTENQTVLFIYISCYSLFIIVISTVRYRTLVESRLCSPIYPFIIVLIFLGVTAICRNFAHRKTKLLFWIPSILAVLLFWFIQSGSSVNVFKRKQPEKMTKIEQKDITGDGVFDVSDIMVLTHYLYRNGPQPSPLQNANVNCDDTINIADVVYLVNYVYKNGPPPCNYRGH